MSGDGRHESGAHDSLGNFLLRGHKCTGGSDPSPRGLYKCCDGARVDPPVVLHGRPLAPQTPNSGAGLGISELHTRCDRAKRLGSNVTQLLSRACPGRFARRGLIWKDFPERRSLEHSCRGVPSPRPSCDFTRQAHGRPESVDAAAGRGGRLGGRHPHGLQDRRARRVACPKAPSHAETSPPLPLRRLVLLGKSPLYFPLTVHHVGGSLFSPVSIPLFSFGIQFNFLVLLLLLLLVCG